jgi:hypothetical protein
LTFRRDHNFANLIAVQEIGFIKILRAPSYDGVTDAGHHIQWTKSKTYNDTKEVTEAPELAKKNYQKVLSRFFSGTSLIRS